MRGVAIVKIYTVFFEIELSVDPLATIWGASSCGVTLLIIDIILTLRGRTGKPTPSIGWTFGQQPKTQPPYPTLNVVSLGLRYRLQSYSRLQRRGASNADRLS